MKNGKHKIIRLIRSIRGQKKQTYSLPFREGPGVGFSLTKREAWLTLFHIGVLCDARFALTKIIPKKSVSKKVAIRR